MNTTIRSALQWASTRFLQLADASPRLDAEVLLCHVLQCRRSFLLTWPDRPLTAEQHSVFDALVTRRAAGEPVAYIIGIREFWSLDIEVTPATLIPRPETELLVELALTRMQRETGCAADLGTGSGAVALALATERPRWRIQATDRDEAALAVARANAQRLHLDNLAFAQGDWCEALKDSQFDIIVSNPPYIAENDPHLLRGDVRFEPSSALASQNHGMADIRCLARCSRKHLLPGAWLLFEHGPDQGAASRALLTELGYQDVVTQRDLGARERVTAGRWTGARGIAHNLI